MTKIAVIVGSIRVESQNKKLAKNLESLAPEGTEFIYAEISSLPLFNEDVESTEFPAAAQALKDLVVSSDAVLFVTPEYNHSFTGVLKNAIDWGSRPWSLNSWGGKPTGIVGASGASGSSFSQAALKLIIEWFKSPLYIEKEIKISLSPETFDDQGKLHQDIVPVAQEYINGFVAWVNENPSKPE